MVCEGSSEGFLEEEALLDFAECEDAPWHGCLISPLEGRGRYFDGVHFAPHPLSGTLKGGGLEGVGIWRCSGLCGRQYCEGDGQDPGWPVFKSRLSFTSCVTSGR